MRCPNLKDLPQPPKCRTAWPWTQESPKLPEVMSDGKPWPKISIVTPNYNFGQFIENTIRSVLLQGYPNLEYIIIDAASTDNSVEIIKKYEKWLTYWVSETDSGQSQAINKGFAKATGEILAWLNSDDRYLPATLKIVAQSAMAHPNAGAFAGRAQRINLKGKVLLEKEVPGLSFEEILNWHQYLAQSSCFFRRKVWQQCGPLDETLHFQMDFDLWLKIARKSSFIEIPEILSQQFFHKEAKTIKERFMAQRWVERWSILMRYDQEKARRQMLDILSDLFTFRQKVCSLPLYRFFKLFYKRKD